MSNRPIKRNKYITDKEIDLYNDYGKELIEGEMMQSVYYYKVNVEKTSTDDLYGEVSSNSIILENPIQIEGIIEFDEPSQENFLENNTMGYMETGNMIAKFYLSTLKENGITFCLGDFIAYRFDDNATRFFQITQDGRNTDHIKYTFLGRRPYYTDIIATVIDKSLLNIVH